MARPFRRHRYPKKRNILRVLLFTALPALLLCLLIGSAFILGADQPDDPPMPMQLHDRTADLAPDEAYPQGPLSENVRFDKLVLEKGLRRLTAYAGGKATRVYLVALGENPVGAKEYEGDKRTPEGSYSINNKNPSSAYYKNLGISYPDKKDLARAKKAGKSPGGDIKIHGLAPEFANVGRFHRLSDWTFGCIAVTNEEMEELFQRTPVGVPINILP